CAPDDLPRRRFPARPVPARDARRVSLVAVPPGGLRAGGLLCDGLLLVLLLHRLGRQTAHRAFRRHEGAQRRRSLLPRPGVGRLCRRLPLGALRPAATPADLQDLHLRLEKTMYLSIRDDVVFAAGYATLAEGLRDLNIPAVELFVHEDDTVPA